MRQFHSRYLQRWSRSHPQTQRKAAASLVRPALPSSGLTHWRTDPLGSDLDCIRSNGLSLPYLSGCKHRELLSFHVERATIGSAREDVPPVAPGADTSISPCFHDGF